MYPVKKLQDCATIIAGQSPESKYYNTVGDGIPFFQGKADFGELYPSARVYCTNPTKIAQYNDILLSVRAPVGPTNLSPGKVCIGRGLAAIRPDSSLNLKYLLYYFHYFESQLSSKGTGTTFKAITQKTIKNTQPAPSTLVLDKLSAIAVDKGVQPVIVCTKGDLAEAEFLRSAYEKSTLPFIRIDYGSGAGLDEIKQWISGRLCAFCGNSGVGKSTLLNALLPDAARETSAISQKLGRGRHTTREVTIFEAFGGRIADTPGFASLEANRAGFIPKENLEHAFPEFGPYLGQCQFTGCSHRTEKGCAVRQALAEGKLSQTRYDSYCAMYDEVKDVKDWQRPKV